ncbi:MAG TPA: Ig-like domain-containing protein [Flavobacteriales bacterium]|nr:Ig-like domain-containing protein [Flavobacteriales bacterium]
MNCRYQLPLYSYFCFFLVISCAQMGEPTGGELDNTAPEIIKEKTVPSNQSVNFNADKIIITFDEYVTLKNPQVNITPAMDKRPTMKVKGKQVIIDLNEKPVPNTTYTINLAGAISDITESNAVKNLQYVFSTGTYLDSLSISGRVVDAFKQSGISSTVILHSTDDDSSITKEKPAYFLKTDRDGSYKFSNLKQGKYRVYALNDKNADLLFSGFPEEIAYLDTTINLVKNITDVKLMQFKPSQVKASLSSSASLSKWVQRYNYTQTIKNVNIRAIRGIDPLKLDLLQASASDSIFTVYMRDTLVKDTIVFELLSGQNIIDTLNMTSHLSRKMVSKALFKLNLTGELYLTDSILVSANMPFEYDLSKITLTDTLHKTPVKFTVKESPLGLKISPQKQTEKIPLMFTALPGTFTATLSGMKSDTLKGTTTYLPAEKMGSIELKFQGLLDIHYEIPTVVLLLDGKYVTQKQIDYSNPKAIFNFVKPGNYTFYIFDDVNLDGTWTPGNFTEKQQPEKIKWYTTPVKVKANWQQDLTWVL